MPSGLSETAIYNLTLDRLAEETVLSPDDEDSVARWLKRNYGFYRDLVLEAHTWNFAIKRAIWAAESSTPEFEWSYQYVLPGDLLRLLPVTCDGRRNSPTIPHVVENGKLLTNKSGPLKVRYIYRNTNTASFSMAFSNVLALTLAGAFAYTLTGKASITEAIEKRGTLALQDAMRLDSLEGQPEEPEDNDILAAR